MIVHQIFAVISGEEIVNIMTCDNYELANQLARMTHGDNAFAIECTQYPCSIGDKYIDRQFFFKDGTTLVPRQNTAEEDVKYILQENKELKLLQSEQDLALIEQYENQIAMNESMTKLLERMGDK